MSISKVQIIASGQAVRKAPWPEMSAIPVTPTMAEAYRRNIEAAQGRTS